MTNETQPALYLCRCRHWAGEHTPAGGACEVCECTGWEAAEVPADPRATLAEMLVYLPVPHTLKLEFSRPLSGNRGSARIAGVEAIGISGGMLFVCCDGVLEAMIPIERLAYVGGEAEAPAGKEGDA